MLFQKNKFVKPENLEFIAMWEASGWKAIDVLKTVRAMIDGLPMRPPIRYEMRAKCRDCGPKDN